MSYQEHDFEDEWGEEIKPKKNWILWLGISILVLFLIGLCLIGSFFLVQQFQRRTAPPPALAIPTIPGGVIPSPIATEPVKPTDFPLAPTATLPSSDSATAVPIPSGSGNVTVSQLSAPPQIDGNLSEWEDVKTIESAFRVYTHNSWDGTDDVMGVWRLGWDANNLYIAVQVTDDTHVQTQTGNLIFRGDSIDMQLDMDRDGDYDTAVSLDDFQIIFSPGDFAGLSPSAFRFRGTTGNQMVDAPGHNITLAAKPTDLGYNLEAAIPWSDLAITPSSGLVIGAALNVSDNDGVGTAVQEMMKSHVSTRKFANPASWGTLTLN